MNPTGPFKVAGEPLRVKWYSDSHIKVPISK